MGDTSAVERALARTGDELGPIDILVNNAAVVWPLGPTATINPAQWELAVQINLLAPVRLTTAALPGMIQRAWGRIVNVSSGVAANPDGMIGGNAYTTTKAALEEHTLNLAAELRDTGVTANIFRPGAVDTSMQGWIREQDPTAFSPDLHKRFIAMHESGTLLTPERSASALLEHLRASGTGQIWNVSD